MSRGRNRGRSFVREYRRELAGRLPALPARGGSRRSDRAVGDDPDRRAVGNKFVELANIRIEKGDAPFRPVLELLDGRGVGVADLEPAPERAGVRPVRRGELRRVLPGLTVGEKVAPQPRALGRAAAPLEGP